MKKTLLIAAVALISASAFAAEVTSANIVGYVKIPEPASGIDIVAPQFLDGETITLGVAFTNLSEEALLYAWNGSGYDSYIYYNGYGWYDFPNFLALQNDTAIDLGQAFWLSGGGSNALFSGEVPSADTVTNAVSTGLNLIANPYPVAMTLGTVTNNVGAAPLTDEDLLYAWNGSSYVSYIYYDGYGWYDFPNFTALQNDTELPVGKGFWLSISGAGGNLVFSKLY